MNYYVVVEGELGAKRVYEHWIPFVNGTISPVFTIQDVSNNNAYVVSGGGIPFIENIISAAVVDVNNNCNFDKLVVAVDSEDISYTERRQDILALPCLQTCRTPVSVIIHHFCFETWALGNKRAGPRNPRSETLRRYKSVYDVFLNDPELLPRHPNGTGNRAHFAFSYLKAMLTDKYRNVSYTKNNPQFIMHQKYFSQLRIRLQTTGHIPSLNDFIAAFT